MEALEGWDGGLTYRGANAGHGIGARCLFSALEMSLYRNPPDCVCRRNDKPAACATVQPETD